MTAEPTVKVIITATQKMRYRQTREIPISAWRQYEAMCEANARDSDFAEAFERLIHPDFYDEVDSVQDLEMERVEETVPAMAG